jgi:hypothetical protein
MFAVRSELGCNGMDAVEAQLVELERMSLQGHVAEALPTTSEFVRELRTTRADERLVARAESVEAVLLYADGKFEEAIAIWQRVVTAHGHSGDPKIRLIAAAAQHNIANGFMCRGDSAAAEEAMDKLVAQFGEVALESLQVEAVRHAKLLGRPLDPVAAGAVALATARILARYEPARVASVTDPAVAELRGATPSPTHDMLIEQLEQLRAEVLAS